MALPLIISGALGVGGLAAGFLGSDLWMADEAKKFAKEIGQDVSKWTKDTWEYFFSTTEEKLRREQLAESAWNLDENPSIWGGGEPYKPTNSAGQVLQGPFGTNPNQPIELQSTPPAPPPSDPDQDYLNALLAASLMQGQKPEMGRPGQSAYGVGAQVPAGDPYRMYREWEQSYRRL